MRNTYNKGQGLTEEYKICLFGRLIQLKVMEYNTLEQKRRKINILYQKDLDRYNLEQKQHEKLTMESLLYLSRGQPVPATLELSEMEREELLNEMAVGNAMRERNPNAEDYNFQDFEP